MKNYKNEFRFKQALYHAASMESLEKFLEIYNGYTKRFNKEIDKGRVDSYSSKGLLYYALKNNNEPVSIWLIEQGFATSIAYVIDHCDYNKVKDIFNFVYNENGVAFSESKNWVTTIEPELIKKRILNRLLDPEKVKANTDRIDFVINLINDGFVSSIEVLQVVNSFSKHGANRGLVIQLLRDLRLTALGI